MINNLKDGISNLNQLIQQQDKLDKELRLLQERKKKHSAMFFKIFDSIMQNAYKAMSKIAQERSEDYFSIPLIKVNPQKPEEIFDYYKYNIISGIYRINPVVASILDEDDPEGLEAYRTYMKSLYNFFLMFIPYRWSYESVIRSKNFAGLVSHVFSDKFQNYKFTIEGREYEIDSSYLREKNKEYMSLPLISFIGDFRIDKESGFVSGIISLNGSRLIEIQMGGKIIANLKLAGEITRNIIRDRYRK